MSFRKIQQRLPDWEERLQSAIDRFRSQPDNGWRNCALMGADFVMAMTGVDFAEDFRSDVQTESDAFSWLRSHYQNVADFAVQVLGKYGLSEVPIAKAKRGDVILRKIICPQWQWAFGIYLGSGQGFFLYPDAPGYSTTRISRTDRCWHF